jgi:hypothetical protein
MRLIRSVCARAWVDNHRSSRFLKMEAMPMALRSCRIVVPTTLALASTLLLAGSSLLAAPQPGQDLGALIHNGVEMKVHAVVAVWNPGEAGLKLTLLPYVPTAKEIAALQSGEAPIFIHSGKASPDPKKWPSWIPFAVCSLSWSGEKSGVGDFDKAGVHLYAFGIGKEGSNLNFSVEPGKYQGSIAGAIKPGGAIEVASKGTDTLFKDKLSWNLKLKAKVLKALAQ